MSIRVKYQHLPKQAVGTIEFGSQANYYEWRGFVRKHIGYAIKILAVEWL